MPEEQRYSEVLTQFNGKLRSLEEKQRLLKERILLIGRNLVESREKQSNEIGEMRADIDEIKDDMKKIKKNMERMSREIEKRARKKEVDRLGKEMKMFSPLEFARIKDVKKIVREELDGTNK